MPLMFTEGCVDWQGFGRRIAQEANQMLSGTDAVLIFDESGFAKKGEASASVARPCNGRLGEVDNCQVGVFATLCRGELATLIDPRLYLPAAWCNDDERFKKAVIPEDKRPF
jgi:SRSO17 transposase